MMLGTALIGGRLPSVSFRETRASDNDATSYTFNTVDIGAAARRSLVIVGVECSAGFLLTCTIGGVSATRVDASGDRHGIFAAVVPTGATATINVTTHPIFSNTFGLSMGVWAAYDLKSTAAHDADDAIANPNPTISLDIPAKGIVVGFALGRNASGNGSIAWTGALTAANKVFDEEGQTDVRVSGASLQEATGGSGQSITATYSEGEFCNLVAASWR